MRCDGNRRLEHEPNEGHPIKMTKCMGATAHTNGAQQRAQCVFPTTHEGRALSEQKGAAAQLASAMQNTHA